MDWYALSWHTSIILGLDGNEQTSDQQGSFYPLDLIRRHSYTCVKPWWKACLFSYYMWFNWHIVLLSPSHLPLDPWKGEKTPWLHICFWWHHTCYWPLRHLTIILGVHGGPQLVLHWDRYPLFVFWKYIPDCTPTHRGLQLGDPSKQEKYIEILLEQLEYHKAFKHLVVLLDLFRASWEYAKSCQCNHIQLRHHYETVPINRCSLQSVSQSWTCSTWTQRTHQVGAEGPNVQKDWAYSATWFP